MSVQPVPIDPRIRRRRIEVRREEGRRRLRILVSVLTAGTVGAAGWLVTRSPLLDVDRVRVRGARHAGAAAVVAASGVRPGEAMTDVREREVERRVRAVPWVADARVSRRWPGTVQIAVRERVAVATVRAAGGTWMLVDGTGRALAPVPGPREGLVALEGTPPLTRPGDRLDPVARGALAVGAAIPRERVGRAPVVALVAGGAVEIRLTSGGVVRFGAPERIREKLTAAFTVLDRIDTRGLAILDVTVPDAPFVVRANAPKP